MTTTLIAMRHGRPDYSAEGSPPLSEEGRDIHKRVCLALLKQGYQPGVVYTSPVLRALQTAKICCEVFGCDYEVCSAMGLEMDRDAVFRLLQTRESGSTVCFVGHAPSMGNFVEQLVGHSCLPVGLSKSGGAIIQFSKELAWGHVELVSSYRPDTLL